MRFMIDIEDELVEETERKEDTIMVARIKTILVRELQKYNSNLISRDSVRVLELPGTKK